MTKKYQTGIKKLVKSSGDISPISQLRKENNDLISDDYEKVCLLNNYLCSISTLNDSNLIHQNPTFLSEQMQH